MNTNIYLIRHGKTIANDKNYLCSSLPGSILNEDGIDQTKLLAKDIEKMETVFDAVHISPFQRTIQTFHHLNTNINRKWFKRSPVITTNIKELDYGLYSGENPIIDPQNAVSIHERIAKHDNNIRFGITGENEYELMLRIYKHLIDIIKNDDTEVVLITHQCVASIINKLYSEINSITEKVKIENAKMYKTVFTEADIKFIEEKIEELEKSLLTFSPYLLSKKGLYSKATFIPSVDLPKDLTVTTPLTFPFTEDDKVLLAKDKSGWWNPVGGHIEEGETIDDTLLREADEEAGAVISDNKLVGYALIEQLNFDFESKYPPVSIIPFYISKLVSLREDWKPLETYQRKVFTVDEALVELKKRDDNNQMFEILSYIKIYLI